jgi:beta-N-acetylhexosaminidase
VKARNLPLRHQVGQLLILGFEGTSPTPSLDTMLRSIQPGGTILFARNIESAQQTYELNAHIHKTQRIAPFLCVDLEGGTVDRLRKVVAHAPDVASIAATGQKKVYQRHGRVIGEEVRALGFNVDFAPVLDLGFEASQGVLGSRTAAAEPKKAIAYASAFLDGLAKANVLGSGKHFPGLGEGNLDTHNAMAVIPKTFKRLWEEDLRPYRELKKKLPFVMVAHAAYPAVTKAAVPASLSPKWMRGILREKIGYPGVIISDDLEMGAALSQGAIEDVSVETLRAGADMFLICRNEDFIWRSYEAVLRAAERERRFAAHIAAACDRVLRLKAKTKNFAKLANAPNEKTLGKLRKQIEDLRAEVVHDLPM